MRRRRRCGNAMDPKQIQKQRVTFAPQPLPRRRPRALSCPLPLSPKSRLPWNLFHKSAPQQRTSDQSQSALARLPWEIRHQIWSYVLGGRLLHIVRGHKTLLVIECLEDFGPDLETRQHGCWGWSCGPPFDWLGFYMQPQDGHPARPANLLPLLQTCRVIYTEAVAVLYESNIFDFNHLDSLLYFRQSVLPQRLNQIRRLNLSWDIQWSLSSACAFPSHDLPTWYKVCDVLASFHGLQELRVHLTSQSDLPAGEHGKPSWKPLLDALQPIKWPTTSVVYLPSLEDQCAEAAQDSGYQFTLLPGERE
ncbi:hypothetical protein BJX96DRAFT_142862 [Aspergillus floccosus]